MGATTSVETQRPNSSVMVGSIGPGLFWLLFTGSIMLTICVVVNLKVIKMGAGARAGLNGFALLLFGTPFLFYVLSRKEPRVNPYIVEDLEFTYTNYWARVALFITTGIIALVGLLSYVGVYAAKPIQAEFHEDDIEQFDPRTHIYR